MEQYFLPFRTGIIGVNKTLKTPYQDAIPILYADWTASGRLFQPIEQRLQDEIYPLVANTHTDTNDTGLAMTYAYHRAKMLIKKHVNAGPTDIIISSNSGMTGVVNKFQRILGFKLHEKFKSSVKLSDNERPIVFVTHMEHHSNQTSWLETIAEVKIIPSNEAGLVCLDSFKNLLDEYKERKVKIAAITSYSNVTGIITPFLEIAELIHAENGLCFVDFAASAPYIDIDMHSDDLNGRYFDAIYFSPHKFLGGPGSSGILIFNRKLYQNKIPDNVGGGTVQWTDPWGRHKFIDDIEISEDGGTPAFLQTIKAAMCMQLKEQMGVDNILKREEEQQKIIWEAFDSIPNLHVLADQHRDRLGIYSFYIDGLHYNVGVKLLNDKFGIQTRGGCSCAGTYGHHLFNLTEEKSAGIANQVIAGDCTIKPGWIRMSIHPTLTDKEIQYLCESIQSLAVNFQEWIEDYDIDLAKNQIRHKTSSAQNELHATIDQCLEKPFSVEKNVNDLQSSH